MALTDPDDSLLKRCLQREPDAWKEFVDRFAGVFLQVIRHTAQTRSVPLTIDDADDLAADVFLSIIAGNFEVLRRFRGESSLVTYLTVIARRMVVHEMTRRRMAEAMGHVRTHGTTLDRVGASEFDSTMRIMNRDLVQRMLGTLAEPEATIVRMFHLHGWSYREISTRLGVTENSIGPTLTRAREKLRHSAWSASDDALNAL